MRWASVSRYAYHILELTKILVVVNNFYSIGTRDSPDKANAVLTVNANTILALTVSAKSLQAIARGNS